MVLRSPLSALSLLLVLAVYLQPTSAQSRKWQPLEERVQQLTDLTWRKPLIRLSPERFRNYIGWKGIGQPERNYSFIVMLTALSPQRQCEICRAAYTEFTMVANSHRYTEDYRPSLFFGYVDFDEGSDIFSQLDLNSAPIILYFGERSNVVKSFSIKSAEMMDIQRIGLAAETIARWVTEKTGVHFKVARPANFAIFIPLFILAIIGCVLMYRKREDLSFVYNRTAWGYISLAIVFLMISGQMWCHIRKPPLMHQSKEGITYIHSSSSGQFILETYIVMALYASFTFGLILLIEAMKQGGSPALKKKKWIFAYAGLILVSLFFSLLLSVFRSKTPGYPYSFLLR